MTRLVLVTLPTTNTMGFGAPKTHRQRELRINEVVVERFSEDSVGSNYISGPSFDKHVEERIKTFETALDCTVVRQDTPSTTGASMTERYAELTVKQHLKTINAAETQELTEITSVMQGLERQAFAPRRR